MSILAYHMVDPRFYFGATRVTPSSFETQVRMIRDMRIPVRTLTDYLSTSDPERGLAITFDDGFQSVFQYAFPILERYHIKATVFVIPAFTGQFNTWDVTFGTRARLMNWDELGMLCRAGWEIGSHTLTHKDLRRISRSQRTRELQRSRNLLQQHLNTCSSVISFPFGNTDAAAVKDYLSAGYRNGVVLSELSGGLDPEFNIGRQGVYLFDSLKRVRQKITGQNKMMNRALQRGIGWCSNATVAVKEKEWQIH
ncbi:MAG: polysaccharide deacetylase family protein [candidate division KSB1 bacterium]|nr:polysaccharide deacetylase family protein [candidate division KSB1 bacterium]